MKRSDVPPVPDDPIGQMYYSLETLRMASQNWSNMLPWRLPKWHRTNVLIDDRARALKMKQAEQGP